MGLQQGQTEKNFERYWIWHSEKTKTTCEQCKKHDGKKFYKKEDIPKLPVHPNCKCYVEEVVKEIPDSKIQNYKNTTNGQCDCLKKARELRNKIENLIISTDEFSEEISVKYLDFLQLEESSQSVIEQFNLEYNFWKNEIGKHQPDCFKDPNQLCSEIYKKKMELEKIKTESSSDSLSTKFSNFLNDIKNFQKELRNNLLIDINVLVDNIENDFIHSKNDCKFAQSYNRLVFRTSQASVESNQFKVKFKTFVEVEKKCNSSLNESEIILNDSKTTRKRSCKCAESGKIEKTLAEKALTIAAISGYHMPIAGANLNDAMNDFAAANKNKHVTIVDRASLKTHNEKIDDYLNQSGIKKDIKGVIYDEDSVQSKVLFNTNEIRYFIWKNKKDLKNGKFKDSHALIGFNPLLDTDAYLGIQHCRIYNPHIDENGYFNAVLVDYYDFDRRETNSYKSSFAPLNNWGHAMQEKGYLKNYFVVYCIKEKVY